MDNFNKPHVSQALATVQQSLATMQALQAQTTQAHQKFLETQAEAHRTLQQMVHSTRQLTASLLGHAGEIAIPDMPPAFAPGPKTPVPSNKSSALNPPSPVGRSQTHGIAAAPSPDIPQPAVQMPQTAPAPYAHKASAGSDISKTLIQIVSELTGYPQEMLGLEMDIEADLGIDSIKRVEILSALEEQMPHLPKITPDMMGTLKNLGQIRDYLSSGSDHAAQSPPASTDSTPAGPAAGDIQEALLKIVSELTGYPREMLGLEMDIEADLGIDSIKRVEILSALEEQMPHLPKITPDRVGALKSLGQICNYLSSGENRSQGVAATAHGASPNNTTEIADIQFALVGIVSELTGYPREMLGLEMDIEADLGIDSIKRVEILSALEEQMPHLPKITPDMVGTLKTLQQIRDYLSDPRQSTEATTPPPAAAKEDRPDSAGKPIERYEIQVIAKSSQSRGTFVPADGHIVGIITEEAAFAQKVAEAFQSRDIQARCFKPSEDLPADSRLAGLAIISPISSTQAFRWARQSAPALQKAGREGHAFFHTVSRLDGAFGFSGRLLEAPEQGALAGLAKTAGLEWPEVRCRALDLDPRWTDLSAAATALVEEMVRRFDAQEVETGVGPDGRTGLEMVSKPLSSVTSSPALRPADVVLVSGGGRGVTAAATLALAIRMPCTFALLGRSPEPQPEPEWLASLNEQGLIKQAILKNEFTGQPASPKSLEQSYRRWMANREILNTIERLQQLGIRSRYYCQDVCQNDSTAHTIMQIRRDLGPIRGLIHGAGVLEDRFITDKTLEQFKVVYDTKVKGLLSLLNALREDKLQYLVVFSSISARMGNQGQADYAMANEALNKIAVQQSHLRPDCRVCAINWGPWDGGMVSPSLKRNFESQGVPLIPLRQGAAAMVDEMLCDHKAAVEVVIGGPLHRTKQASAAEKVVAVPNVKAEHEETLLQTAKREIDVTNCPVLRHHVLDGRPVVPLALITEWLAHGALHANPGLLLHGMDHLRMLKGIALEDQAKTIRLMAGTPRRYEGVYEVEVQIRDGGRNGNSLVHSSAKAILADRFPAPPPFEENGHFKPSAQLPSLEEIYDRILFHGDAFKGIKQIIRLTDKGMTARVSCAPPPEKWLDEPLRSRWIADPLVLDCAFQMAIVWCYQQRGVVSLPSYAAAYRQYRDRFPSDGVTAVLEVTKATDRKLTADFIFLDEDKKIIARMTGYEAAMDEGLFRAFGHKGIKAA